MTNIKNASTDVVSFRDLALSFSDKRVATMSSAIKESFARRDLFEAQNALGSTSYTVGRDKMIANVIAVARFFLALDVKASAVIERKVSTNAMFNAKALKKIVELSQFVCNKSTRIEKVMSSFIICALAFDAKQSGAISNKFNKSFLSSINFDAIIADFELAAYLADYQHKFMSGGKDTQSSQARNVLDVLGLGSIVNCDSKSRGGIEIARDHAFYADFTAAFCK